MTALIERAIASEPRGVAGTSILERLLLAEALASTLSQALAPALAETLAPEIMKSLEHYRVGEQTKESETAEASSGERRATTSGVRQ